MKKFFQIIALIFSINTSPIFLNTAGAQTVSFQVFYDDLSQHGSWYESPDYGYIWRPSISGFTPYSTGGYWTLTEYGWTWVSDYSWGWAPFHYGRWYYDPTYGYVWVPGYEWGPGWVTWRRSDDYYGWAPIGPGVSINVAYSNGYNIPYNRWNFVRCNDFGRRDIHNYYINRSKNVTIINNTTVINTTKVDNIRRSTFTPGPDRLEVQRKVGRKIDPVAIVDEAKPVQRVTKNNVQLYRPVVENRETAEAKPAPRKAIPMKAVQGQQNTVKDNQTDRNAKKDQLNVNRQPVDQQRTKQENDQAVKQSQQQPAQKTIRDEQPVPARREQVQQQNNRDQQPEKREPVQQPNTEQPAKQREEVPPRPDRTQANEQPVQPQSERVQRKEQAPQPQQRTQPSSVQQPQRQQRVEQRPVQQAPERQQRIEPRQNMDRPAPRQPIQQPVPQRQPIQPRPRKG